MGEANDEDYCSAGGMAVDLGEYRRFSPGDVIRVPGYATAGGYRVWMVYGVHLGGEKQESTYELLPLDYHAGIHKCHVPCVLLEYDTRIEKVD
jgi:hypothetical protein